MKLYQVGTNLLGRYYGVHCTGNVNLYGNLHGAASIHDCLLLGLGGVGVFQ